VKDAYDNGSKNCQMLLPDIQKDITKACAEQVTAVILDEIRVGNSQCLLMSLEIYL
jgi:hypothetical protein